MQVDSLPTRLVKFETAAQLCDTVVPGPRKWFMQLKYARQLVAQKGEGGLVDDGNPPFYNASANHDAN